MSLNSRLESNKEKEEGVGGVGLTVRELEFRDSAVWIRDSKRFLSGFGIRSKAFRDSGFGIRTALSSRNHSSLAIPARVSSFSGGRPEAGPFLSSEAGPSTSALSPDGRRAMQCASQHFMPSETQRPPFATMLPAGGMWDQGQFWVVWGPSSS